jgi:glycosyltransferase involved in cell wall biosynthesis
VDTELRGTKDAPLRVLSVARLHWKKGFDDAIRAVALALANGVHVQYRIAGEGPEREKLAYLRHSLGWRIPLSCWDGRPSNRSRIYSAGPTYSSSLASAKASPTPHWRQWPLVCLLFPLGVGEWTK